ncbi:MAG: hypothetical protein NDJ94_10070 [Vicinamibacteria bacterium]|nr:hypothetical protein [Vicinamibacteria bacterium]
MLRDMPVPDVAWIEQHRVCWEQTPLREMVKGHGLESHGVSLTLFARFDVPVPGHELKEITRDVHARCVQLLRLALADHAASLRVDIDAFDFTGHLRPETQHAPEVDAVARVVADQGGAPDPVDLRDSLLRAERVLREHGLHERVWDDKHPVTVG